MFMSGLMLSSEIRVRPEQRPVDRFERRPVTNSGEDRHPEMDRGDSFQQLQASFTSAQRTRPPVLGFAEESEETRVPLKARAVPRRESRAGLRGMFTRNKAENNPVTVPVFEEPSAIVQQELSHNDSSKSGTTLPASTPNIASKPSLMNLKPKSVKIPPSSEPSSKSFPQLPKRTSQTWDPPPLFQAYPQAIKHATLTASTLSADSIIRINNHKRPSSSRDDFGQSVPITDTSVGTATKKSESEKRKHRRQVSDSISKAEWTQKTFVLVTSGYLLQYAGDGTFDRLPEKMLQLGKDSVAFASDVIPGKHWVIQISQSINADGTPTAESRSLLSRLAFKNTDYRRTATNLLLVLNSAEDMDTWLAVIRREIEALGGRQSVSETGKPKPDENVTQLKAQPNHRYLVRRDTDQFSNSASPISPGFASSSWTEDPRIQGECEEPVSPLTRTASTVRPSTGHETSTKSVTSHDTHRHSSLRDSAARHSFVSSGQRTLITSHNSSPTNSPTCKSFASLDEVTPQAFVEDPRPRPNRATITERRQSAQAIHVLEAPYPSINRHSTYTIPTPPTSSHSPTTPNFSTSKRLSRILVSETLSMPTIVTTSALSNPPESVLKGSRKGPPAALNLIKPRSPVEKSASPSKRDPPVFTPGDTSFKMVPQVRAAVVNVPSKPLSAFPNPPKDLSHRTSSVILLGSTEMTRQDFSLPKRKSTTRILHTAVESPELTTPATVTTPLPSPPYDNFPELKHTRSHPNLKGDIPILANSKQKFSRPASQMIRPPVSMPSLPLLATRPTKNPSQRQSVIASSTAATAPISMTILSPSNTRLKVQAHPKAIGIGRSMPMLVNGPPPAPPPAYALPPLPPGLR